MAKTRPIVGVIMGSDSDLAAMEPCLKQLEEFGIACEARVLSAHRSPQAVEEYAASAGGRGVKVIIAGAGMSAALAGVVASWTVLPVIGVAMPGGVLQGFDALLSTVQTPPGVPVACTGIGPAGATNAAMLAAEILALSDADLAAKLVEYKAGLARKTLEKDRKVQGRSRP